MQTPRKSSDEEQPSSKKNSMKSERRLPYHGTLLNTPFFHIACGPILPVLKYLLAGIYAVRWQLSRPLQIRILPKWFPFIDLPLLKYLPFVTFGHVALLLPLMILIIGGYYVTFVSLDLVNSGNYASYALFATFLTANKTNSLVTLVFGIPFERLIPYHFLSAFTAIVLSCFHVYIAFVYGVPGKTAPQQGGGRQLQEDSVYVLNGPHPNFFKFLFDGDTNRSGSLLAIAMVALVATSLFPILRRKFFDVWLWTHIALAVCVVVFAILHSVSLILMIAAWWAADVVMRVVVMAACRYPSTAYLERVGGDVVKISFPKPDNFAYNAGQFVQIAIAEINILAFHPLSIASAPHEPMVTLYARALGCWTEKLLALADKQEEVSIMVEGPYGSISMDAEDNRYQMALCVCGGIGVTHCQSIAKSLLKEHERGRPLKQLRFVWAIRDLSMLGVMPALEDIVDIELAQRNIDSTESFEVSLDSMSPDDIAMPLQLVETDIFVTKKSKSKPSDRSLQNDPRNIHFGRPDLNAIIQDVKEEAERQHVTHVAVFGCGPKVMLDKLQEICRAHSSSLYECGGITFDVHEEVFEF